MDGCAKLLSRPSRNGLSLIELIVVIGILAVMLSLLSSAVQHVRGSAARLSAPTVFGN